LPTVSNPAFVALAAGTLAATVIDIRTRRIPNALTASMACIGIAFAVSGISGVSLLASLAGLALGCALMLPGHVLGATGAGDVKLMAAVGAMVGPVTVLSAFAFTAIAGGVIALVVAVRRRRFRATLAGTGRFISAPTEAKQLIGSATSSSRFAYGPAIAMGSVLAALIG
jgi:prepilin peptidase CpaA